MLFKNSKVILQLFQAGHAAEYGVHSGQVKQIPEGPGCMGAAGSGSFQNIRSFFVKVGELAALYRLHYPHGNAVVFQYLVLGGGVDKAPVQIVQLYLGHVKPVPVQHFLYYIRSAVGGEAKVAYAALFLLLQQKLKISVGRVGVFVKCACGYIVEKINIEIFCIAALKLPVEHFLYVLGVRHLEFGGKIV